MPARGSYNDACVAERRWKRAFASKDVGDVDRLKVFANEDAAEKWFRENDPEGIAFEHPVIGTGEESLTGKSKFPIWRPSRADLGAGLLHEGGSPMFLEQKDWSRLTGAAHQRTAHNKACFFARLPVFLALCFQCFPIFISSCGFAFMQHESAHQPLRSF
jgi:hypothetical protein